MPLDWQASAIEDLINSDLSMQEIATKYGRDRDTIFKLRREHAIVRKKTSRKGSRPASEMKQISPAHGSLGLRITAYRGVRNYTDLAQELNVSRYVVQRMEIGAHDFTLTQLQKLSTIMGRNIEELIAPHRPRR